jgi:hypothetical protein
MTQVQLAESAGVPQNDLSLERGGYPSRDHDPTAGALRTTKAS